MLRIYLCLYTESVLNVKYIDIYVYIYALNIRASKILI